MVRLYADENFPLPVVMALRRLGHDILTTHESGKADQAIPDEDVLKFAKGEERAVLTLNRRHFIHLHQIASDHAGIIVCTFDSDFDALAERIHDILNVHQRIAGNLIRVNRPLR